MKYGLLLPHFGQHASRDKLLEGSKMAEGLGFDSVWVRDHLVFEPHGFEAQDTTFYEALTTLTAVGAVTERITLGTGSLIPFRHPLHTALSIATIAKIAGPRLIIGFGAGTYDHEFAAVGMGGIPRVELVRSNVEICRGLWYEDKFNYKDEFYHIEDITMDPKPGGNIPFWYCGATPRSARLAVEYADGWMPGRITLLTLQARVEMMAQMVAEKGVGMPTVGVIPPTSIARDHEAAFEGINIEGLLDWANKRGKWWVKPHSGRFETIEDIEGSLIAGTPDEVIEQVGKFADVGVDHIVFDLRFRYDQWYESIQLLGENVLPELRK